MQLRSCIMRYHSVRNQMFCYTNSFTYFVC